MKSFKKVIIPMLALSMLLVLPIRTYAATSDTDTASVSGYSVSFGVWKSSSSKVYGHTSAVHTSGVQINPLIAWITVGGMRLNGQSQTNNPISVVQSDNPTQISASDTVDLGSGFLRGWGHHEFCGYTLRDTIFYT